MPKCNLSAKLSVKEASVTCTDLYKAKHGGQQPRSADLVCWHVLHLLFMCEMTPSHLTYPLKKTGINLRHTTGSPTPATATTSPVNSRRPTLAMDVLYLSTVRCSAVCPESSADTAGSIFVAKQLGLSGIACGSARAQDAAAGPTSTAYCKQPRASFDILSPAGCHPSPRAPAVCPAQIVQLRPPIYIGPKGYSNHPGRHPAGAH